MWTTFGKAPRRGGHHEQPCCSTTCELPLPACRNWKRSGRRCFGACLSSSSMAVPPALGMWRNVQLEDHMHSHSSAVLGQASSFRGACGGGGGRGGVGSGQSWPSACMVKAAASTEVVKDGISDCGMCIGIPFSKPRRRRRGILTVRGPQRVPRRCNTWSFSLPAGGAHCKNCNSCLGVVI